MIRWCVLIHIRYPDIGVEVAIFHQKLFCNKNLVHYFHIPDARTLVIAVQPS